MSPEDVRSISALKQFIRFPSVSAQPERRGDLENCAQWLASYLRRIGMPHVRLIRAGGPPLVYAAWRDTVPRPSVLIYGHYDVQPADPLGEWKTPPFEPVVRDGFIYGRGAADDKGQLFAHVTALERCLRARGRLPVNIQFLAEGEEETGSEHLLAFLKDHAGELRPDAVLISDMAMAGPGKPAITYSLRGTLSLEIEFRGLPHDLHSGQYGGAVLNPVQALAEMLAGLHDHLGRIAVPGFYDRVCTVSARERREMARAAREREMGLAGVRPWGEIGYSSYERETIRPSLAITSVTGGYQGPGIKSVIPASACAKLNFRLVPDQRPGEIERLVRRHIACATPAGIHCAVRAFMWADPAVIDRDSPVLRAAAAACVHGFGRPPVMLRSGGTIPVANLFKSVIGSMPVLLGLALPDDGMHAPNERFSLANLRAGVRTSLAFLDEIALRVAQARTA